MFTQRIISVLGIIGMIMFNKQKDEKTYSKIKIFSITILTLFVLLNIGCNYRQLTTKEGRKAYIHWLPYDDDYYNNCIEGKHLVPGFFSMALDRSAAGQCYSIASEFDPMIQKGRGFKESNGDLRIMYDLAKRGCQLYDPSLERRMWYYSPKYPDETNYCKKFLERVMRDSIFTQGILSKEEIIELQTIGVRECAALEPAKGIDIRPGALCNKVGTVLMTYEPINMDGAKTAFEGACRYGNYDSCQILNQKFGEEIDLAEAKKRDEEVIEKRELAAAEYERKREEKNQKGLATLLGTIAVAGSGGNPLPDLLSGKTPSGTEAAGAGAGTTNSAGQIPKGSYSSWSQAERDQAGPALGKMCESECASYKNACKAGGQRPCYEAAACTAACFVNNLPDDYPQLGAFIKSARENYNNAKKLGSNVPVFLKGR